MGTDPAGVRADARTAVPGRRAVHPSRPHPVPAGSAAVAHQPPVCPRLQRGPAHRPGHQPHTHPDQTHIAHFWAEPSRSGWSRVANLVSERYRYDLHRTARLQALLNMAMADSFIVGWYQKRHFALWRPLTAIRKADTDGNPSTEPDPSWLSLRPTPPLPDYPSTHSLLGGAAAEILRRFTGTNGFPFCMVSTTSAPSGTERCWDSFTQAELENTESRVLAGFHFRFAIETGVNVGRKVGSFATRHALRPLTER